MGIPGNKRSHDIYIGSTAAGSSAVRHHSRHSSSSPYIPPPSSHSSSSSSSYPLPPVSSSLRHSRPRPRSHLSSSLSRPRPPRSTPPPLPLMSRRGPKYGDEYSRGPLKPIRPDNDRKSSLNPENKPTVTLSPGAQKLVDEFKSSGKFDELRRKLLNDFRSSVSIL